MRLLYSALFYCLLPFVLLRMLWRSRRAPEYRRRWGERLGFFTVPSPWSDERPWLWLHAVSVGETLAAAPVVEALLARYPDHKLVLTTTTPTGSEQVRKLFGERVFHVYAPWDLPGAVQRFLKKLQPRLLVIMETELWPNTIHLARKAGCRIVLANARMSARSARGYQRLSGLTRPMLTQLNVVACQAEADAQRLQQLGMPESGIEVTGSIKFDLDLDQALQQSAATLRADWRCDERPIVVAASTHAGEDEQILAAFRRVREQSHDALLVLVPRHPERFNAVESLCMEAGYTPLRRSTGRVPDANCAIVLGDTMGELLLLLSTGRVAIIGGSLVPHGGHNVLEAAAWGVPVLTGPHIFNFAQISELMVAAGAMLQLENEQDLPGVLVDLLSDATRLERMGKAGLEVVAANRGALERLLAVIGREMSRPA